MESTTAGSKRISKSAKSAKAAKDANVASKTATSSEKIKRKTSARAPQAVQVRPASKATQKRSSSPPDGSKSSKTKTEAVKGADDLAGAISLSLIHI